MEKKRYEIQIAGTQLAIISDEREEFIKTLVENLDKKIRDITVATKRGSTLDAAILCSLEYYSEKVKAEKRARNLEAQISLYDANLRRFREENIALREKLQAFENNDSVNCGSEDGASAGAAAEGEKGSSENNAEKEAADAEVKNAEAKPDGGDDAHAARLRAIEELLGRGGKKDN